MDQSCGGIEIQTGRHRRSRHNRMNLETIARTRAQQRTVPSDSGSRKNCRSYVGSASECLRLWRYYCSKQTNKKTDECSSCTHPFCLKPNQNRKSTGIILTVDTVRLANVWWRRGESNSGPRKPPDWHLQAQSLVLSRTLCAQRHARGVLTGSVLARAIPITCAGAFP